MEQFIEQAKKDRYPVVSINKAAAALKDNPRVNYEMFIQEIKSQPIDGDEVGRYITELCMDCGMSDPNFKVHIEAVCDELCNQIEVAAQNGFKDDLRKIASYYKDDIESLATARAHKEYNRLQSFEAGAKRISDCAAETKFSHKHEEALVDAYVQKCNEQIEQMKQEGKECPAFIVNMSNAQFEQNMMAYAEQLKGSSNEIASSMRARDLHAEFEALGNPRSALEAALERKYSCDWINAEDFAACTYSLAKQEEVKEYCNNAYFYALKNIDTEIGDAAVEAIKKKWANSKQLDSLRNDYIAKVAANCEEDDEKRHIDILVKDLPQATRNRNAEMQPYLEFLALSFWTGNCIVKTLQDEMAKAGVEAKPSEEAQVLTTNANIVETSSNTAEVAQSNAKAQAITAEMYTPEEALDVVAEVQAAREAGEPTVVAAMTASLKDLARTTNEAVAEVQAVAQQSKPSNSATSSNTTTDSAASSTEESSEKTSMMLKVFRVCDTVNKKKASVMGQAAVMKNMRRLVKQGVMSEAELCDLMELFETDPVKAQKKAQKAIDYAKEAEADEKRKKARRKRNVANPKLGRGDKDVDYYTNDGLRSYGSGHRTSPWAKLAPILIGLGAIIVLLVKGRITGGLYILPILGVVLAIAGFLMRPESGRKGGKPIWLLMVIGGVLLAFMTL